MRHGLYLTEIRAERRLNQVLAVARGAGFRDKRAVGQKRIYFIQNFYDGFEWVAAVSVVIGVDNFRVFVEQHRLGGGRARVYTKIARALMLLDIRGGDNRLCVAAVELLQLLFAAEQRSKPLYLAELGAFE